MPTPSPSRWRHWLVYGAFLVVAIVSLWVPIYDHLEPAVGGVPFFYWFQVAWIVVAAVVTAVAYRLGV